jgi:hypothetical protein
MGMCCFSVVNCLSTCITKLQMSEKLATIEDLIPSESTGSKSRPKLTKTGKILLGISGASFVGVFAAAVPFLLPAMRRVCLPYVPATTEQVRNVMSLLKYRKPGQRLVDLGSGDGRIVIEAARQGFQVFMCFATNIVFLHSVDPVLNIVVK